MGCPDAEAEDFVCDYHLEMLSLSQDQQNPASIQFDDLSWQCHLPSLKPLGLNIMLNLCNVGVTQQLCRFADHLSNMALQESHGSVTPIYVPWGLCELSRLIGDKFTSCPSTMVSVCLSVTRVQTNQGHPITGSWASPWSSDSLCLNIMTRIFPSSKRLQKAKS